MSRFPTRALAVTAACACLGLPPAHAQQADGALSVPAQVRPESPAAEPPAVAQDAAAEVPPQVTEAPPPDTGPAQAALAACLDGAGAPSAEVPVSEAAQRAHFRALAAALPDCRAAVDAAPDTGPDIGPALFHLATAAQAQGDHRRALDLYSRAADAGVAPAWARLGDYDLFGIGPVRPDPERAITRYTRGLEAGDAASAFTLAMVYQLGRGVPRDTARAAALLDQAAASGYHFAKLRLAELLIEGGDPAQAPRALRLLAEAAEMGNRDALLRLADLYSGANPAIPEDPEARFTWTDRAAQMGHAPAIAARGLLYETGTGVPADPVRAAQDYIAALETGDITTDALRRDAQGRTPYWQRDTALEFQRILRDRGLYNGPLDAIIGGGTMAGARRLAEGN